MIRIATTADRILNLISEAKKVTFKNPSLAFEMSKEAYQLAKSNELKLEEAHALFAMSLACRSLTKLHECFDYAFDAYMIYEDYKNPVGLAGTLNLMGIVYYYYAMYERAIEYFLKALHLLKETEDYITMSRLYNNMGEVYREVGDLEESLISYNKALDLCEKYNYVTNIAVILENLGEIYFRKEDYSYSYECYQKSYAILAENDDITALAELENRMGKIHYVNGEYGKARDYYNSAITKLEGIKNKFFTIDVLINLAELEMIENEGMVLVYLSQAIKYSEEINARKKLSLIYKMLTQFYESKNDYEAALEFYKRFHLMEQEIETTVVSAKLEIIKIELGKLFSGEEVEKITKLNIQLEQDIEGQNRLLELMEKANRNLEIEVLLDELTKITNRRGVNNYISAVWSHIETKPIPLALLMIDIDHFKKYNDCHGHLEGDACLKIIAERLKQLFGKCDGVIGRYGGEEFICFVKNADYENVLKLAESLRRSIEKLQLNYISDNISYPVTISIGGIHGNSDRFKNVEELYLAADEELYKAKDEGRNRISLSLKDKKSAVLE